MANALQTRETVRRNDLNAEITQNMADSLPFVSPEESPRIEAIHFHPCANDREHVWLAVLLCPFGAMDLGGDFYPGRRVAAPPRRSALGYFVIAPSGR
jgi:hypothetical protein